MDPVFEGLEGGPGSLIKYNPLSNVTSPEVWNFLRAMVCGSYVMLICPSHWCPACKQYCSVWGYFCLVLLSLSGLLSADCAGLLMKLVVSNWYAAAEHAIESHQTG